MISFKYCKQISDSVMHSLMHTVHIFIFHKLQPSAVFYTIENSEQKPNVIGCFFMLARQLLPV